MNEQPIKRIPYGVADYRRIRTDQAYYVDKTHFIPLIEAAPYYLFCIRPRRFGKTLWLPSCATTMISTSRTNLRCSLAAPTSAPIRQPNATAI